MKVYVKNYVGEIFQKIVKDVHFLINCIIKKGGFLSGIYHHNMYIFVRQKFVIREWVV